MGKPRLINGCCKSVVLAQEFEKQGWEVTTCDLLPSEGWHRHIQGNILNYLNGDWDMGIFHPPCTHLSKAGGWCWKYKKQEQLEAFNFVLSLWESPISKMAIENPIGWLNTNWQPPMQIMHPYYFGDPYLKETCLWLKGLPKLTYVLKDDMFYKATAIEPIANWVKPGNIRNRRFNRFPEGAGGNIDKRSRTFPGIANAMAEQ